jgi:hypothetical protein
MKLTQRLQRDVEAIALPRGRRVGSPGHRIAEAYLEGRLGEIGCVPYQGGTFRLPYAVDGTDFVNLVGVVPSKSRSGKGPLLIGAHYDSAIDAPCADDNAAAVAIALAAGAMLAAEGGLERDVVIAIFDAEEPPYFQSRAMGSNRFYEDQMDRRGIHAAVVMDLVGHDLSVPASMLFRRVPGMGLAGKVMPRLASRNCALPFIRSALFITGTESHPALTPVIRRHHRPEGLKVIPTLNRYVGDMSDHGAFRKGGVPYLFLSCGHWQYYHTLEDTPDRLNYRKMAAITGLVISLMKDLDRLELQQTGGEQFCDTLELERDCFHSALGFLYRPMLRIFGVNEITNRKDMGTIVNGLTSLGL